jgi:hypothetical protein
MKFWIPHFQFRFLFAISIFFLMCFSPARLWAQSDFSSHSSEQSQSSEEISSSEEPILEVLRDQDRAMIQGLKKVFAAHEEREEKSSFFKKWPVRLAKSAVVGFLPTAGVSLFRPQDPWMKPTIGKTYAND